MKGSLTDDAQLILTSGARTMTGDFLIDDDVLAAHGVADIDITAGLFVPSLRELAAIGALAESF